MSSLKDRWHLPSAMILIEHNDTPVQSQPHRNMGSRNEGGLERTSRGLVTREAVCQLLPDAFLIPGALRTKWDSWHRNAFFVLFLQKKRFYVE